KILFLEIRTIAISFIAFHISPPIRFVFDFLLECRFSRRKWFSHLRFQHLVAYKFGYCVEWDKRDATLFAALAQPNQSPVTPSFGFVVEAAGQSKEWIAASCGQPEELRP